MALKPCRECGAQVSTEAEVCPHCGVRSPTTSDPLTVLGPNDSKQAKTSGGGCLKGIGVTALIIFGLVVLKGALFPEDKTQPDIATPAAPVASSGTTRPPVAPPQPDSNKAVGQERIIKDPPAVACKKLEDFNRYVNLWNSGDQKAADTFIKLKLGFGVNADCTLLGDGIPVYVEKEVTNRMCLRRRGSPNDCYWTQNDVLK